MEAIAVLAEGEGWAGGRGREGAEDVDVAVAFTAAGTPTWLKPGTIPVDGGIIPAGVACGGGPFDPL